MISRALTIAALACAMGLAGLFRPALTGYDQPDEKWLETVTPQEVRGVCFVPSSENPNQTYKMNQETYDMLKPYGIVARVFEYEGHKIDTVVIAGDNADSFHDQRACFESQGWQVVGDQQMELTLPDGRKVPMVQLDLASKEQGRTTALYAFRGPSGKVFSQFGGMWRDYFVAELTSGRIHGGEFFRFIDLSGSENKEPLYRFAGEFMQQAMEKLSREK